MKLNQKLIQQLRNGEIAVENNGTLEQLKEVIKAAFPKDLSVTRGLDKYYYVRGRNHKNRWWSGSYTKLPAYSVTDFYETEQFTGWAKDGNFPKWMMYFKDDKAKFGFDSLGDWLGVYSYNYSEDDNNRPATQKEIERHLIQEAKRRGYKGGDTIKGIHDTTHWKPEICSFYYDSESDSLVTDMECVIYEAGQWAEIVEQSEPQPIHYTVEGMEYSLDYQDLKQRYQAVVNYSDEVFMDNLPEIAHLACIISCFKGLNNNATIGDKGIIHELIHLMTSPDEPTNDLQEIRESFNEKIKLV